MLIRMFLELYIFRFLHQTTTVTTPRNRYDVLYIFRFLHQTTTSPFPLLAYQSCISFVFYIKPQPYPYRHIYSDVVYLSFSTSNHNHTVLQNNQSHVVYLSFSTSNHNKNTQSQCFCTLYIFRFLHQTTTLFSNRFV